MMDITISADEAGYLSQAFASDPRWQGAFYADTTLTYPDELSAAVAAKRASYNGIGLAKSAKTDAVNAKRDSIIGAGYQHNFGASAGVRTLDQRSVSDAVNWLAVKGLAGDLVASGDGDALMELRDAANQTFTCSAETADKAMSEMGKWRSAVAKHSWDLKDAITAASDQTALNAIDINAGWPE